MESQPLSTWSFYPLPLLLTGWVLIFPALLNSGTRRHPPHPKRSLILSGAALTLLFLITCSPLDTLAHQFLLVARSAQHLLLLYLLCPLLLATFASGPRNPLLLRFAWLEKLLRWLGKPLHAALCFNLMLMCWYIPELNALSNQNLWIRQLEYLSIMGAGLVMWLPLMHPRPWLRPPFEQQIFYLVMLLAGQVPLFAALTLSRTALYQTYLLAPRLTPLSAYGDQQSAGWLIKLISVLVFAGALIAIVLQWHAQQRLKDQHENRLAYENLHLVEAARARQKAGTPPQG